MQINKLNLINNSIFNLENLQSRLVGHIIVPRWESPFETIFFSDFVS